MEELDQSGDKNESRQETVKDKFVHIREKFEHLSNQNEYEEQKIRRALDYSSGQGEYKGGTKDEFGYENDMEGKNVNQRDPLGQQLKEENTKMDDNNFIHQKQPKETKERGRVEKLREKLEQGEKKEIFQKETKFKLSDNSGNQSEPNTAIIRA